MENSLQDARLPESRDLPALDKNFIAAAALFAVSLGGAGYALVSNHKALDQDVVMVREIQKSAEARPGIPAREHQPQEQIPTWRGFADEMALMGFLFKANGGFKSVEVKDSLLTMRFGDAAEDSYTFNNKELCHYSGADTKSCVTPTNDQLNDLRPAVCQAVAKLPEKHKFCPPL